MQTEDKYLFYEKNFVDSKTFFSNTSFRSCKTHQYFLCGFKNYGYEVI